MVIEFKEIQLLNIPLISITEDVLKLEKLIDFNELHLSNIEFILVINDESKLEKSIDSKYFILSSSSWEKNFPYL